MRLPLWGCHRVGAAWHLGPRMSWRQKVSQAAPAMVPWRECLRLVFQSGRCGLRWPGSCAARAPRQACGHWRGRCRLVRCGGRGLPGCPPRWPGSRLPRRPAAPLRRSRWGRPGPGRLVRGVPASAALKPARSASLGFQGKQGSRTTNWCRLSLRKSAQPLPPCPSYSPKNEHCGQL
jgi:hypothetical protein